MDAWRRAEWRRKYLQERAARRALHNELQELRGNIRVICRIRAVGPTDPIFGRFAEDMVRPPSQGS